MSRQSGVIGQGGAKPYPVAVVWKVPHETQKRLPAGQGAEMLPLTSWIDGYCVGLNIGQTAQGIYKPGIITSIGAKRGDVDGWLTCLRTDVAEADRQIGLPKRAAEKNAAMFADRTWNMDGDPRVVALARAIAEALEMAGLFVDLAERLKQPTSALATLLQRPILIQTFGPAAVEQAEKIAEAFPGEGN